LGGILKDVGASPDGTTSEISSPFEAEPPEPYEEPSQEIDHQEEGNFLKLQPDVVSEESKPEGSIADEIEQSLKSPLEHEIQSDPGQPTAPKTDPQKEGPLESTDEEINKTLNIEQAPESPPSSNQEQEPETNDNTDNTKE
jgi:hypothetical protein